MLRQNVLVRKLRTKCKYSSICITGKMRPTATDQRGRPTTEMLIGASPGGLSGLPAGEATGDPPARQIYVRPAFSAADSIYTGGRRRTPGASVRARGRRRTPGASVRARGRRRTPGACGFFCREEGAEAHT